MISFCGRSEKNASSYMHISNQFTYRLWKFFLEYPSEKLLQTSVTKLHTTA